MSNRPLPSALKLVLGNPGKRPLTEDEFKPSGEPIKPKWLKGIASKRWDELAPVLIGAGVLTAVDGDAFAAYCALAAELQRSKGAMVAARLAQMRAIGAEFGIGAASRSKLHVRGAAPKSPASKYFGEKHGKA